MLAFDPDADAEVNREAMLEAAGNVDTGLVTLPHAIPNSADIPSITEISSASATASWNISRRIVTACARVARSFTSKHTSFITLIYGRGITDEQAEEAKRVLASKRSIPMWRSPW